ncbi:hypothetical protein HDU93_006648 [Gonapodya sp. JEL0774]|nr:hypothetical protein HDU93_006648 [Gonapodya sp. JEL0774]
MEEENLWVFERVKAFGYEKPGSKSKKYKIKWEDQPGKDPYDDTWEPPENLPDGARDEFDDIWSQRTLAKIKKRKGEFFCVTWRDSTTGDLFDDTWELRYDLPVDEVDRFEERWEEKRRVRNQNASHNPIQLPSPRTSEESKYSKEIEEKGSGRRRRFPE